MNWGSKTLLITGGTGSFGKKFVEVMLREHRPKRLVIFSRDELKQHDMRVSGLDHPSLRYFIGDVRDLPRLSRAMVGIDYVVHAAAMKQVPACEYNPFEAVATNILGAKNVIDAAIKCGVQKVLALSSDKAVEPINLYGATKLVAEKLFVQGNVYSGGLDPRFSCVRYGNVAGSRGSVIPLFLRQRGTGKITITDERMTRFWIALSDAVSFVISRLGDMVGGEVFVPRLPSMRVVDLATVIAPHTDIKIIGIRPGEKIHEMLISIDEVRRAFDSTHDFYIILPIHEKSVHAHWRKHPVPGTFHYRSDNNTIWLSKEELRKMVEGL